MITEIQGLDNYNWGLSFSMPLFLRQPRGELKMNEIKLENTNFELQAKAIVYFEIKLDNTKIPLKIWQIS